MPRRQTMPERWLLVTEKNREDLLALARKLPLGSGMFLLVPVSPSVMRRLRLLARSRQLDVREDGAARVHNLRELRRALSRGIELIMLSPVFPTATHPGWPAIPPMRAAAYARLADRRLVALGGMNERRYARVAGLGFTGWAGLSAFRT